MCVCECVSVSQCVCCQIHLTPSKSLAQCVCVCLRVPLCACALRFSSSRSDPRSRGRYPFFFACASPGGKMIKNTWALANSTYSKILRRHELFICYKTLYYVTRLIYMRHHSFMRDMTHSDLMWVIPMGNDSFLCDMTHQKTQTDVLATACSVIYMPWHIHMWRGAFIRDMFPSYYIYGEHPQDACSYRSFPAK